jgi:hypothetical protein
VAAQATKPAAAAAAAPAASGSDGYLAFENWGASLGRSGVGAAVAKQFAAYVNAYGFTGYDDPTAVAPPAPAAGKDGKDKETGKDKAASKPEGGSKKL